MLGNLTMAERMLKKALVVNPRHVPALYAYAALLEVCVHIYMCMCVCVCVCIYIYACKFGPSCEDVEEGTRRES